MLGVSVLITLAIGLLDWWTKPYVLLGILYLFPIMLSAPFVPRWVTIAAALACSALGEMFSSLGRSGAEFRLILVALALAGCGLFAGELIRNRVLIVESQERLRVLVETSPAAIVTIDNHGFIELANQAAHALLCPRDGTLVRYPIASFLPELHHALRREEGPQFRTSMQCRGHRDNGETFLAEVWLSTYRERSIPKLAAIIGEIPESAQATGDDAADVSSGVERTPLSPKEVDVLRFLVQGLSNKEIAARLGIGESAVKHVFQQLFSKIGVRTRSQLVRVAVEEYRDLL